MAYLRKLKRIHEVNSGEYPRNSGKYLYSRTRKRFNPNYSRWALTAYTSNLTEPEREKLLKEAKLKYPDKRARVGVYHRHYWLIEESYREGDKVKSRTLYSLSKYFKRKPTKKQIKKLLDEKKVEVDMGKDKVEVSLEIFGKRVSKNLVAKTTNDARKYFTRTYVDTPREDYEKLFYAYEKLNDNRWKKKTIKKYV